MAKKKDSAKSKSKKSVAKASPGKSRATKVKPAESKIVRLKGKAVKLASSPAAAEVVAAALVATAAALRDPAKARRLAESAADELGEAGKQSARKSGALWQLALEVARRSLEALGDDSEPPAKAGRKAAKTKKK